MLDSLPHRSWRWHCWIKKNFPSLMTKPGPAYIVQQEHFQPLNQWSKTPEYTRNGVGKSKHIWKWPFPHHIKKMQNRHSIVDYSVRTSTMPTGMNSKKTFKSRLTTNFINEEQITHFTNKFLKIAQVNTPKCILPKNNQVMVQNWLHEINQNTQSKFKKIKKENNITTENLKAYKKKI